ncbi:NUDIX hydrolase [Streptomyces sp. NPDC021093]|uniref:NUDIX hydrolase n=1 Tax=Streptomyces sp. NPDC021093 TaxID=3365112 RepID=UPI0037AE7FEF
MSEQQEVARRESARVLVRDGEGRVLLFRFREFGEGHGGGYGWCVPGGGVESGESLAEAAARELGEETGLVVAAEALGGVVAETAGHADLGWAVGEFRDVFFQCQVGAYEVDASGLVAVERDHHAGHRWWTVEELRETAETVHPFGLAELVGELMAGRVPVEPVRLPWHH